MFFSCADVFVFASRTETQGLVLLEALAQGTPVVSTAVLGTRSVLQGDCGAVVVEERPADMAQATLQLLRDAALRARLAARARAHAQSWSSQLMARRLAGLYRSLQAARPGPTPAAAGTSAGGAR